ncbi:hypothetical protein LPU83_pLPU83d_1010 (plasmid) [Rhizobium favelukesii]|uniref:Uncharacterized protein n=1 Tax=Rhizobium favelukesii TaxID=348824 RepID=W6RQD1_9HYPH|nr:hypothetical protein LPU83_pLPU83d_1010 [Rhizobium favelukesii]
MWYESPGEHRAVFEDLAGAVNVGEDADGRSVVTRTLALKA